MNNYQKRIRSKRRNKPKPQGKKYRFNERIRIPEVSVIGEDGAQLGVMPTNRALALAQEKGLDLVEVSPLAQPPVCRIMDYGKFQYQQSRSQQKIKKTETKGVRLSFKIGEHDMQTKQKQVTKFLNQGHKVNIELRLKGREKAFKDKAKEVIETFLKTLEVDYKVEKPIDRQGATFSTMITKGKSNEAEN